VKIKKLSNFRIFIFGVATITVFLLIASVLVKNQILPILTRQDSIGEASSKIIDRVDYPRQTVAGIPARIKIPSIKVDAVVEHVGLTPTGAMDVSKSPNNAAWFDQGPRPGEIGSSVIDGHSGWKNNIPATFDYLYKMKKGDKIYIEDANGATTTFVVTRLKTYGKNKDASEVFYSKDGKAHLNLITCAGVWNEISKSSPNRLVVFADKI